jgi:hypothetical protein
MKSIVVTTESPGESALRQVRYHPARPTRDGRTVLTLSLLEFLAALSRLVPPPRDSLDRSVQGANIRLERRK